MGHSNSRLPPLLLGDLHSEKEYQHAITMMFQLAGIHFEEQVQCRSHKRIDLKTKHYIIELKKASDYRTAVGQILEYSLSFPKHKKMVILFGEVKDIALAQDTCKIAEIELLTFDQLKDSWNQGKFKKYFRE